MPRENDEKSNDDKTANNICCGCEIVVRRMRRMYRMHRIAKNIGKCTSETQREFDAELERIDRMIQKNMAERQMGVGSGASDSPPPPISAETTYPPSHISTTTQQHVTITLLDATANLAETTARYSGSTEPSERSEDAAPPSLISTVTQRRVTIAMADSSANPLESAARDSDGTEEKDCDIAEVCERNLVDTTEGKDPDSAGALERNLGTPEAKDADSTEVADESLNTARDSNTTELNRDSSSSPSMVSLSTPSPEPARSSPVSVLDDLQLLDSEDDSDD